MKDKIYHGWLSSNNLMKRSFAIYGHFMIAHIIVVTTLAIILAIFGWY